MSEAIVKYLQPDPVALAEQTGTVLEFARQIEIDSAEVYGLAADELKSIKGQAKALDNKRREIVDPLNKAVKSVNDLFRAPLETLKNSEAVIKHKMIGYDTEQARIAAEAQRQAEEEARRERERLQREAEAREAAARQAAAEREAVARAEAARAAAEAAKEQDAAKAEQMRREAAERLQREQAEAAAQLQREQEQAAALAQQAQFVMAAPVPAEIATKAEGTSIREAWKAEVTDMAAFVAHVAAHPDLVRLLKVDQTALNQQARALKDALHYPGVRVYTEKSIAARAV